MYNSQMKNKFFVPYIMIALVVIFAVGSYASFSLSDDKAQMRFFHAVLQQDQVEIDKLLSQGEVGIDDVDQYGRTALHIAAAGNNLHFVHFLLNRGADLKYQNAMGLTALSSAALGGNVEIFRYLVARGADPLVTDKLGGNALTFAKHNGHQQIVDFLVAQNSAITTDLSDWDDLHSAAYSGNLDIFAYLVEKAATTSVEKHLGLGYLASALDQKQQQPYQTNIIKASIVAAQYETPQATQMFFVSKSNDNATEAYSTDISLVGSSIEPNNELSQVTTISENTSKTISNNNQALMLGTQLWDQYVVEYIRYKANP